LIVCQCRGHRSGFSTAEAHSISKGEATPTAPLTARRAQRKKKGSIAFQLGLLYAIQNPKSKIQNILIVTDLQSTKINSGAILDAAGEISLTFGNDAIALQAARSSVAIYDRSHWGKILVGDRDRFRFLHNQSTADFESRNQSGDGYNTVFVTSTARTIDLATALILAEEVLLIVSPNRRKYLFDWLDRYIFFADRVTLKDVTDSTASFTIMGEESRSLFGRLGCPDFTDMPGHSHLLYAIDGIETRIVAGTELGLPGYQFICDRSVAAQLWQKITTLGAIPLGENAWEVLRIQQGRPKPDAELTEDYNPLEVGLWDSIFFDKGCYIGQETIARLNTYKGVKQYLWGVKLAKSVNVGTPLTVAGEKVGVLTSCMETDAGIFGLGYVRAKAGGVGLKVSLDDVEGEVIDLPFVRHEYPG
jgi:tRNA-modifying protein YgfZ